MNGFLSFLLGLTIAAFFFMLILLLILVLVLYWLLGFVTKNKQIRRWLTVLITAAGLTFFPDPSDALTGGFPAVDLLIAAIAGFKLYKVKKR